MNGETVQQNIELRRRVEDLETALRRARDVAQVEHAAADLARESAGRAWRVGIRTTSPVQKEP